MSRLLAEAELAEDGVEQIFGGGLADDFANGFDGEMEVECDEFEGTVGAQGVEGEASAFAGATQGVLMAGVDGDLRHLGIHLPGPDERFDRVFQGFDAVAGNAGNVNNGG